MIPYLDAGFLLALLVHGNESYVAMEVLGSFDAPFALNFLHQLQAENLLVRLQKDKDPQKQKAGNEAQRMWRHRLEEGVFQLVPTDWESTYRVAIAWNAHHPESPPAPLLLLHPAAASVAGATHFLSFDPRPRAIARSAGMELLPARL
jgi:hypothetical protein